MVFPITALELYAYEWKAVEIARFSLLPGLIKRHNLMPVFPFPNQAEAECLSQDTSDSSDFLDEMTFMIEQEARFQKKYKFCVPPVDYSKLTEHIAGKSCVKLFIL